MTWSQRPVSARCSSACGAATVPAVVHVRRPTRSTYACRGSAPSPAARTPSPKGRSCCTGTRSSATVCAFGSGTARPWPADGVRSAVRTAFGSAVIEGVRGE
ncbi:hypothetical protein NFX46_25570 [Streptomyces phaeoluteigriseus]|uniref:Uncharacterized protein n=1 Tax=Streptomyces phaeoluteigriseus TaxID=114686 RepID=A0ABY4ZCL7_9ACTN|nr:hypothetical protein [Streptomyces phaeoluteigriseus]USQ86773.1 hypothetical protein NFX46_25570 [Streptomyces phaeoluteigriseus]